MQDIGKVALSNRILDKPGKLSREQRAEMKLHPEFSMRILERTEAFADIVELAGSHHERLDGTGYPQGLHADDISIPVRVAAIADVFCSMTSSREYRPAHTTFEALRIMHTEMRDSLDRDLLREFITLLGREEQGS